MIQILIRPIAVDALSATFVNTCGYLFCADWLVSTQTSAAITHHLASRFALLLCEITAKFRAVSLDTFWVVYGVAPSIIGRPCSVLDNPLTRVPIVAAFTVRKQTVRATAILWKFGWFPSFSAAPAVNHPSYFTVVERAIQAAGNGN